MDPSASATGGDVGVARETGYALKHDRSLIGCMVDRDRASDSGIAVALADRGSTTWDQTRQARRSQGRAGCTEASVGDGRG